MDKRLRAILEQTVANSLDHADQVWSMVGPLIKEARERMAASLATLPSEIPGYPVVDPAQPQVDNFIAMMVDLRKSTEHLLRLGPTYSRHPQNLHRVLLETSALLPSVTEAVRFCKGRTTEYLGDGSLSFFRVPEANTDRGEKVVCRAYRAAKSCLEAKDEVINPSLERRYGLPPLSIGIGMAYGQAIVTVMGSQSLLLPKALGHCVFKASKLSCGRNAIRIDGPLKEIWPKSDRGRLRFRKISAIDDSYEIEVKQPG